MRNNLAQTLMDEFADSTGISGKGPPRRYLWTDAFAVCNFLGLAQQTGDARYLKFAHELVDQVHHILGRHRDDDARRGRISGLPEEEGEQHPTRGGLRIGKTLNERGLDQPPDSRLEWDRDGQYFHYLTKWMHALDCMGWETGEIRYHRWARELAITAHHAFVRRMARGGPKGIAWKMSIDLTRPLVSAMGQHDPLDGLVTLLELKSAGEFPTGDEADFMAAIADMTLMCARANWATEDPLGIGGLLDDAARLARLVCECGAERRELLYQCLVSAEPSLQCFGRSSLLGRSAEHRLAFRELGLSIGMRGLQQIRGLLVRDRELATCSDRLLLHQPVAEQIEAFWSDPRNRLNSTWADHCDINTVMLATSLAPEGYLQFSSE